MIDASTLQVELEPYVSKILCLTVGFHELCSNGADVDDPEFDVTEILDTAWCVLVACYKVWNGMLWKISKHNRSGNVEGKALDIL